MGSPTPKVFTNRPGGKGNGGAVDIIALGLIGLGYLLGAIYHPMAIAVVAIEGTRNPLVVFRWIRQCLGDYLPYLLIAITFPGVGIGLSFGFNLLGVLVIARFALAADLPTAILLIYGVVLLSSFCYQFVYLAQFAMLGTMRRRHRSALKLQANGRAPSLVTLRPACSFV